MSAYRMLDLELADNNIAILTIDTPDKSVNVLNSTLLQELSAVLTEIGVEQSVEGLLIKSAKSSFVVGADISEFTSAFALNDVEFRQWMETAHDVFSRIENLPFPTVSMINSLALGGGLELAMSTDFRVADDRAKIGLPEVSLGICPGWGGTVRLSRLAGTAEALKWILAAKPVSAVDAKDAGVLDLVVSSETLDMAATSFLLDAINGALDYRAARSEKNARQNTTLSSEDNAIIQKWIQSAEPHYPAAAAVYELLNDSGTLSFEEASSREIQTFIRLARTHTAQSLISRFLNHQKIKKATHGYSGQAHVVERSAVLGAGIMGGGIAYQSAIHSIPILMKDINQDALDLGMRTASKSLDKMLSKGRINKKAADRCLAMIDPVLDYHQFGDVDFVVEAVVEAVVENVGVKSAVLQEVEDNVSEQCIVATNTSTISVDTLAASLKRPELFCGMHFFNPVPLMPLVEIIRGTKTNSETIATAVTYAARMGKTPIVVNDCPGFLVNRILFPYFNGFNKLLNEGVDFERIDGVMEQFGWPMGPAYLADVIGLDTMTHADEVMQKGFPSRMLHDGEEVIKMLLAEDRLGQKNGKGFYNYSLDDHGSPIKKVSTDVRKLISRLQPDIANKAKVGDQEIIDRLMIPLCTESVRCLNEGVVSSAIELDMAAQYGLGFPKHHGGPMQYISFYGADSFQEICDKYSHLGDLYTLS